jgi:hypothetical protein
MKHLFYVFYVLTFSGAVFVTGMFIGQLLERFWSRREEKAKLEATDIQMDPIGVSLRDATVVKTEKAN